MDDIDILSDNCQIKYIITVQALKEGWDCPFAYVLCSFADLSSNVAVEQILGRIIRLPYADWNKEKRLNRSYAFALSSNFIRTANSLRDALISNGFSKQEARDLISKIRNKNEQLSDDLFSDFNEEDMPEIEYEVNQNTFSTQVNEVPRNYKVPKQLSNKIQFNTEKNSISILGHISDDEREEIQQNLNNDEDKITVNKFINYINNLSPSERGENFDIPALAYKQGNIFEVFEESHFLQRPWSINDYEPSLTDKEFSKQRPIGNVGEITVSSDGKIKTSFMEELDNQMSFFSVNSGWSIAELAFWIDRKIYNPDIPNHESEIFINKLINNLISEREFKLEQLVVDKYRLKEAVKIKIEEYREKARYENYQQTLFDESEKLIVSPELAFSFKPEEYPCNTQYDAKNHEFKKHYYPVIGELAGQGEEFECAQFIDSLPEVDFWVRNLSRRPLHSFWLQTSTDKFYPDFVCKLKDGRYLVIEYKGEDRWSDDDSKEKRSLGELWEMKSEGTCLFVMPKGKDLELIDIK